MRTAWCGERRPHQSIDRCRQQIGRRPTNGVEGQGDAHRLPPIGLHGTFVDSSNVCAVVTLDHDATRLCRDGAVRDVGHGGVENGVGGDDPPRRQARRAPAGGGRLGIGLRQDGGVFHRMDGDITGSELNVANERVDHAAHIVAHDDAPDRHRWRGQGGQVAHGQFGGKIGHGLCRAGILGQARGADALECLVGNVPFQGDAPEFFPLGVFLQGDIALELQVPQPCAIARDRFGVDGLLQLFGGHAAQQPLRGVVLAIDGEGHIEQVVAIFGVDVLEGIHGQ